MNCGLCLGYQRTKNKCAGCNSPDPNKPKYCISCVIKNCENLLNDKSKYCFNCNKYPCKRLKNLDTRYRTKYSMSMIENLNTIKTIGIQKFVNLEKQKWICSNCGEIVCVHRGNCLACGAKRNLKTREEKSREFFKSH